MSTPHFDADYRDCAIKRTDTDPAKLSLEQVKALANWCDWQTCDLTDSLTLGEILAIFHASIKFDNFEGWLEEEPEAAIAAYNHAVRANPSRALSQR